MGTKTPLTSPWAVHPATRSGKPFKIRSLDDLDAASASSADLVLWTTAMAPAGPSTGRWPGGKSPLSAGGWPGTGQYPGGRRRPLHRQGWISFSGVEIGGQKDQGKILAAVSAARRSKSRCQRTFGIHGRQYLPETLMNAVIELEEATVATGRTRTLTGTSPNCSANTPGGPPVCTLPNA